MLRSFPTFCRLPRMWLAITFTAALTGCADHRRDHDMPGLPPPAPVGMDIRAAQQRQINLSLADRFTLYRNEWADDGDTPGEYGSRHLEELATRAVETNQPLLIERDRDVQLNESRRLFVVHYLAERHIPDPERRVLVGQPVAPGISGEEAVEIYQARPSPGSSGSGAGSSSGGSSGRPSGL
jgi:hypothetical protein